MDILFLCGYFGPSHQPELVRKTKTFVENAANTFQQRLIEGFQAQEVSLHIVSAPLIGPWPRAYRDVFFRGFEQEGPEDREVEYTHFCNVWGYRNLSRAFSLRGAVRRFVECSRGREKMVVVYSPHTPFLQGAVYAKKLDSSVHICMVVPDLPQYMNLSKEPHPIYDFFKKIDIRQLMELNRQVDSYLLLTQHMAGAMQVGDRPYAVAEGICSMPEPRQSHPRGKRIAYAGKLQESFGVKKLLDAFALIPDPEAELELCGGGELRQLVEESAARDPRIHYHGVVPAEQAARILQDADVLVNPRPNVGEYTKYSFPSKNIEYLLTGNGVVGYLLDGMPRIYEDLMIVPEGPEPQALAAAMVRGFSESGEQRHCRSLRAREYLARQCEKQAVVRRIMALKT